MARGFPSMSLCCIDSGLNVHGIASKGQKNLRSFQTLADRYLFFLMNTLDKLYRGNIRRSLYKYAL